MAIAAVDDVWLREPRLLVPRMAPVGNVRLDWQNTLTKDLCFCWVSSPSRERDLVKGYVGARHSSASYTATNEGTPLVCGTGGEIDLDFGTISPVTADAGNFSSLIRFAIPTDATVRYIFGQRSAVASAYPQFMWRLNDDATAGKVRFTTYNSTGSSVEIAAGHNGTAATYGFARVGTDHRIYKNGVLDNAQTLTAIDITAPGTQKVMVGAIQSGGTMPANAQVFFAMCWNRALTDAEMLSVSLDPYQILTVA